MLFRTVRLGIFRRSFLGGKQYGTGSAGGAGVPSRPSGNPLKLVIWWQRAAGASPLAFPGRIVIASALLVLVGLGFGAYHAGWQAAINNSELSAPGPARPMGPQDVEELKSRVQERVDALSARLGLVNAQLLRLEALGRRLTDMAKLDDREFDFDQPLALGGPEVEGAPARFPEVDAMLAQIEGQVARRDAQLSVLEEVILDRSLNAQTRPAGRPVTRGYLSSTFGYRPDPFTGLRTFHQGVDFAGAVGDPVIAVGGGIVTYAGERPGYGLVVEVAHGDGYITRYAHNDSLRVARGDIVMRGQPLAELGSSGRSTGPHVHFELWRNGQPVNPSAYLVTR